MAARQVVRDRLESVLPKPAWEALRTAKRNGTALRAARNARHELRAATRRELEKAPVSFAWKQEAIKTQVRLARYRPDGECRARIGEFEITSFSAARLAALHKEIFVDLAYFFRADRSNPLIVDGGSNIGVSVLFFKTLYPNARVLAFEPAERAFELLARNVHALPGVELHRAALGGENAVVSFYDKEDDPSYLKQSTRLGRLSDPRLSSVEQRRLSDHLDGDEDVDLVKLDVEGSEDAVLQELADSGAMARVQQLIVEYHHQLDPDEDSVGAFLERLHDLGFYYQLSAKEHMKSRETRKPLTQDVLIHAYRRRAVDL